MGFCQVGVLLSLAVAAAQLLEKQSGRGARGIGCACRDLDATCLCRKREVQRIAGVVIGRRIGWGRSTGTVHLIPSAAEGNIPIEAAPLSLGSSEIVTLDNAGSIGVPGCGLGRGQTLPTLGGLGKGGSHGLLGRGAWVVNKWPVAELGTILGVAINSVARLARNSLEEAG